MQYFRYQSTNIEGYLFHLTRRELSLSLLYPSSSAAASPSCAHVTSRLCWLQQQKLSSHKLCIACFPLLFWGGQQEQQQRKRLIKNLITTSFNISFPMLKGNSLIHFKWLMFPNVFRKPKVDWPDMSQNHFDDKTKLHFFAKFEFFISPKLELFEIFFKNLINFCQGRVRQLYSTFWIAVTVIHICIKSHSS